VPLDRLESLRRPARWIPLVLCLAFPPVWNSIAPRHSGESVTVLLTPPHTADALDLPDDRIAAREQPGESTRSRRFAFELDRPGRYSLYGVSSHVASAPLGLWIDGERVSTTAFYAATGSRHRDFETRRIATGVEFAGGVRHEVRLTGPHLDIRTFALELRREAPLGPAYYGLLATVAGALLALRARIVRTPASPRRRLLTTTAFAVAPIAIGLLAVAQAAGPALISTNRADLAKRERLARFESELAPHPSNARDERFSVAVLGDSTHYWSLDPSEAMLPSLERALRPEERGRIHLYGVAAQAFTAFDYYLLLNRLVDRAPDLVVIPVNARSFGAQWFESPEHDFGPIERYLRADELVRSHGARVANRQIGWERVLIRRVDQAISGGRLTLLLRGLRRHVRAALDRVLEDALPDALFEARLAAPDPQIWPREIPADHPMLGFFRRTNRLAARHGVEILYYTVQSKLEAIARIDPQVDLHSLYADLEGKVAIGPGIHYLDLSRTNPSWMFSDESQHLTARGMSRVSRRLARRIAELARERSR
jgi:hypothetical protein